MARDERFGNTLASPGNRAGPSGRTRLAAERDLDRVGEIDGLSFARPWDEMAFREAMKDLFLVYEEGEVEGFLVACAREAGNDGTILKVAVHPGQRGRGIASRLLEAAIREFRERRIREVDLDVKIVKTGVITLYGKFGFRVVRAVQTDSDEEEEFYIMRLRIGEPGRKAS